MRRNHVNFHQKPYQVLGKLIGNSWQFHGKSWSFGSIPLLTSMYLLLYTYCTSTFFVGSFEVMLGSCFPMAFFIQNGISRVLVDNELVGS